ncbi:endocuticle structural glycoprotein SgAbd-8-like [Penaeus monodon]|uniref:endocuticle structural glycoprotein SgAbd-8-like n=1 Tax=Penaeus monodon TaxID=6687 RepID=UPI0018A76DAE|nr:endocuticle structural glycoprotein SgAbd-8-like [Penaeus monodon]
MTLVRETGITYLLSHSTRHTLRRHEDKDFKIKLIRYLILTSQFAFAALVSVCMADRLPSHFGYASPQPSSAFSHRSRPASRPSFSPRPAPQPTYSAPRSAPGPVVPILVDDRVHPDAGAYSFNVETGDGISRQESGSPIPAKEGPVTAMSGSYSFTLPDGQLFELRFVADENGFQPQSPFLPVAPAFPHPIPAHALRQIERARQGPSQGYSTPSRPSRPSNFYGFPQ